MTNKKQSFTCLYFYSMKTWKYPFCALILPVQPFKYGLLLINFR